MSLDSRITLARPDLASASLQGLVRAERFVAPTPLACGVAASAVRKAPDAEAEQVDQLLLGEAFDVMEETAGFAWGQARRDGYVGYVARADLGDRATPTHRVRALRTYAFAAPSIKAPALGPFSLGGLVRIVAEEGRFLGDGAGRWFVGEHLAEVGRGFATDPAAVAEAYLGAAYLWGGRESLGLDCSGLVLQALLACGRACPRDTDMQEQAFAEIPRTALRRGDLVFWRGHVAMMVDADQIIHANAHHMAVAIEPLDAAIARIEAAGSGHPTSFRRP